MVWHLSWMYCVTHLWVQLHRSQYVLHTIGPVLAVTAGRGSLPDAHAVQPERWLPPPVPARPPACPASGAAPP